MDRHAPGAVPTMMVALIVMFTTLRPILEPPTALMVNASDPKPGITTEAELRVKQVATKGFWAFSNTAFALALAAALLQVGKLAAHGSSEVGENVSFMLVMVALLYMTLATKCVIVVRFWPSSLLSALFLIDGILALMTLSIFSGVFMAEVAG